MTVSSDLLVTIAASLAKVAYPTSSTFSVLLQCFLASICSSKHQGLWLVSKRNQPEPILNNELFSVYQKPLIASTIASIVKCFCFFGFVIDKKGNLSIFEAIYIPLCYFCTNERVTWISVE